MNETLTEKITSASEKDDLTRLNAIAAHHALSLALGKTADALQARLAAAVKQNDADSLGRLYDALTKHRQLSFYAAWSENEVERALEMLEASFARLGKKSPAEPKATRNRVKKPAKPLILDHVEQSDLFDPARWPRKPYCTNNFEFGLKIRGLQEALTHSHISANPPHLRVWSIFDLDYTDAKNAWKAPGLPEPTWTTSNQDVNDDHFGYAHLVYGIRAPVLIEGQGVRSGPVKLLVAIESMMREKLQADMGYSGLMTKNPTHEKWQTVRGPKNFYDLGELAAALPGIEKYKPTKNEEKIGLGRNVSLFDHLRKWAYKAVRGYWNTTKTLHGSQAFQSACNSQALSMNADLFAMNPLDVKEVWHIVKSVSRWVWNNTTEKSFSEWQSVQGKKAGIASGKVRAAASETKRASARLMRASGLSFRAISAELDEPIGTVHRWCAQPV